MDIIQWSVLLPLGFAAYGVDCLAERFKGYRLSADATDSLNELWSYSEHRFFRSVFKGMNRMEREMKPRIIEIALRSALEGLEKEGANTKLFDTMEKEAKSVLRRFVT